MNLKHSQDKLPLKPIKTFTNMDTSMKLVKFPQPPGNPLEMIPNFHGLMGTDSKKTVLKEVFQCLSVAYLFFNPRIPGSPVTVSSTGP